MFIAYRGWGSLGFVPLMLLLASCAGLLDTSPPWAITLGGLSLLGGGVACYILGKNWNRGRGFHTMYWAPLENWGKMYIVLGGLFTLLGLVILVKKLVTG